MSAFKTEAQVLAFMEEILKAIPWCYHQKLYLKFTSGFPDLLVGYQGEVAFYELKVFKGPLEADVKRFQPIQVATLKKMRNAGMRACGLIVHSPELAYAYYPDHTGAWELMSVKNFKQQLLRQPAKLEPTIF